ncbi:unnamed protein product [Polarella glacialis]|uniref:Uncharacterized protein n=1 Tax=Polarella glacialis TaxID=89957 RepID=A0A813I560_POLGL|nr:unnamed protein product [Polarella glacialis]
MSEAECNERLQESTQANAANWNSAHNDCYLVQCDTGHEGGEDEWLCSRKVASYSAGGLLDRLHTTLNAVESRPYSGLSADGCVTHTGDMRYPHCNLMPELIHGVLSLIRPVLWLEVGSFIGNSAIRTAAEVKKLKLNTSIVCVDPFTGDVSMWYHHSESIAKREFDFLQMDKYAHVRIYETFLANVKDAGHDDVVLPIRATGIVGMRLLSRLHDSGRSDALPSVIYLDSGETMLELMVAWSLLSAPGVLLGDDFNWDAVREDVTDFARKVQPGEVPPATLQVQGSANQQ